MTYSDSQNKSYQMAFIFAALIGESPEYAWVTRKYSRNGEGKWSKRLSLSDLPVRETA